MAEPLVNLTQQQIEALLKEIAPAIGEILAARFNHTQIGFFIAAFEFGEDRPCGWATNARVEDVVSVMETLLKQTRPILAAKPTDEVS